MQEWVDTLRLKLREMKILSPKENLYSKLPEARPPLLPTRDPMSPLPATPPIPAALVPGVERVFPNSSLNSSRSTLTTSATTSVSATTSTISTTEPMSSQNSLETSTTTTETVTASSTTQSVLAPVPSTSMSNTLTQNLINMLSNPVSAYSSQLNGLTSESETSSLVLDEDTAEAVDLRNGREVNIQPDASVSEQGKRDSLPSLAQTFANNVLSDPNTCSTASGLSSYVNHSLSTNKRDFQSERVPDADAGEECAESIVSSGFPTPDPIVIPR